VSAKRQSGSFEKQLSFPVIWPWQDASRKFSWLKATTLALMFVPAIWIAHDFAAGEFGPVPLGGMTYWSGLWATAILLLALVITPASAILRWRNLIIVRRMIGVTALVYTVGHIVIYFALRFWNFAFIANEIMTRLSLIIATVSTIGLIALGSTSVDAAVRRMGAKGWQRLHNVVYVVTGLAILHYLMSPGIFPDQFLVSGAFFWLMVWRVLDRRGLGTNAAALGVLAIASSLFTALVEIGWIGAYQGYALSEIFSIYFTLALGIPPMWEILALGLAIALVAAGRQVPRLKAAGAGVDVRKVG
jgi:sulfoxide reductase heme-binding subunit YedZ